MVQQFEVYRHPAPARRDLFPYLVVLQHDSVDIRDKVLVVPLVAPERELRSRLYPTIELQGRGLILLTPAIGPIAGRHLRNPIANLSDHRSRIIAAIDMLFAGS